MSRPPAPWIAEAGEGARRLHPSIRGRLVALVAAVGLAAGLGGVAMRPGHVAAIDPCFGYDLCIHLSVGPLGLPQEYGDGTVTSSPAGIACRFSVGQPLASTSTCDHYFHANFVSSIPVTLTAVADPGSTAVCDVHDAPASSCSERFVFTVSEPVTAGFHFGKAPVTVTVGNASKPGGFVYSTPVGIDCGEQYTACQYTWPFGTNVTLTAEGDGANFLSWTGDCALNDQTCELGLEYPINTTAVFGLASTPTPAPKPTPKPTPTVRPTATAASSQPRSPGTTAGSTQPAATEPRSGGSGDQASSGPATPGSPVPVGPADASARPPGGSGGSGSSAGGIDEPASSSGRPGQADPAASAGLPDSMPVVLAIVGGCGLIGMGIVIAAVVARRGRGTPG